MHEADSAAGLLSTLHQRQVVERQIERYLWGWGVGKWGA